MSKQNFLDEYNNNVLDIEEFSYAGELEIASQCLLSWKEKAEAAKSEETLKEINSAIKALTRIAIYVSQMQTRQREYNVQLGRFREAKIKADQKLNK